MGEYKTTNKTDLLGILMGVKEAEVEDSEGNIGRGTGSNQEEANKNAFSNLKRADPSDPNYEAKSQPQSSEDSSTSWNIFGSSKTSDSSQDNSSSSDREDSSSGGYSGGGGYSSGGGSYSGGGTSSESEILKIIGGLVVIGALFLGYMTTEKREPRQTGHTLEQKIDNLSYYFHSSQKSVGDHESYELVMPSDVKRDLNEIFDENRKYEVMFIGSNAIFGFTSTDGGKTWGPFPSTNPELIELNQQIIEKIRNQNTGNYPESLKEVQEEKVQINLRNYNWESQRLKKQREPKAILHWPLRDELENNPLKKTLESLAEEVYRQNGGLDTELNDHSEFNKNIWVAGEYTGILRKYYTTSKGFILHSPDYGKNWTRQWLSVSEEHADPVYGIHFTDSNEGFALTLRRILHTVNGGENWRPIIEFDGKDPSNMFIDNNKLLVIAKDSRPYVYFSYDKGNSWSYKQMTQKDQQSLEKIKRSLTKIHYGRIYNIE
jgi:hypothetical protein